MNTIITLSFEMTRRCNLQCKWCAKGEAENIDITKEIIDKTLSEVKNCFIHEIRITGGEPFVNSDMIVYLFEQLAEKTIMFNEVYIVTNGMFRNVKVADAIKELLMYRIENKDKFDRLENNLEKVYTFEPFDDGLSNDKYIYCRLSTYEHLNENEVDETINFYKNRIDEKYFYIFKQSDNYEFSKKFPIIIEGLAQKNYKKYSNETLYENVRIIDNHYNVIDDIGYPDIIVNKTIQISANGNVWLGNLSSYRHEDHYAICNVFGCKDDFIEILDAWCWEHPNSLTIKGTYEGYLSQKWLKDRGLIRNNIADAYDKINIEAIIDFYIQAHKKIHKEYKHLRHIEVENAVIDAMYLDMIDDSTPEMRELFLLLFSTYYDNELRDRLVNNIEFAKKYMNDMIAEYEFRNVQRELEYKINLLSKMKNIS